MIIETIAIRLILEAASQWVRVHMYKIKTSNKYIHVIFQDAITRLL